MDVQTLEARTGLAARKLRYVIDHQIVPNLRVRKVKHAQGKPRVFSDDMGFAITCAAILLDVGLSRDSVHYILSNLPRIPWNSDHSQGPIVASFISRPLPARVQIGDGQNFRLISDGYDSGWIQPKPLARLSEEYRPRVIIELDLGLIRDQVIR